MKLSIKGVNGFKFSSEKPDEALSAYWINRLKEAYDEEAKNFFQEVSVAMRKLKPGGRVKLESRPIQVLLQRGRCMPKE
jgi:hypothetical protein